MPLMPQCPIPEGGCQTTPSSGPPFWKESGMGKANVFWPLPSLSNETNLEWARLDAKPGHQLSLRSFCLSPSAFRELTVPQSHCA